MKFVFNASGWLQNFNIFFMYCPNARCQRLSYTSGFKKHLYAPTGLNEYFVKRAPMGAYKCFLKPDVYDNLWHLAIASTSQEISWQKKFYAFGKRIRNTRKNILPGN